MKKIIQLIGQYGSAFAVFSTFQVDGYIRIAGALLLGSLFSIIINYEK